MSFDPNLGRRGLCSAPHAIGTGGTCSTSLTFRSNGPVLPAPEGPVTGYALSNGPVLPAPKGPVTEYTLSRSFSNEPMLPDPKGPVTGFTLTEHALVQPPPKAAATGYTSSTPNFLP